MNKQKRSGGSYVQADLETRANTANRQAADAASGNRSGATEPEQGSADRQNLKQGGSARSGGRDLDKRSNAGGKTSGIDTGKGSKQ
ncbi:MAG TPA: hypothetical protein VIT92_16905 [Burkholderiaceae bacterium]